MLIIKKWYSNANAAKTYDIAAMLAFLGSGLSLTFAGLPASIHFLLILLILNSQIPDLDFSFPQSYKRPVILPLPLL